MSEAWVELDGVAEDELPEHASDGRSGDRVSFLESGLLAVKAGRATLVRWGDILGVVEHGRSAHVLVPRRPPAPPWVEIDAALLGDEPGALKAFATRVRERGHGGGYRDAVRQRRQNLPRKVLKRKVTAREPIPGALEVPSTVVLGRSYPGLGPVQALSFIGGGGLGYVAAIVLGVASATSSYGYRHEPGPLAMLGFYVLPLLGIVLGGLAAKRIGVVWRAAKDRTLPRQRVLVLAPDGCIVGFQSGVRTLKWSMVGQFAIGPTEPNYDEGLIVTSPDGERLGSVDAGYLDAPLGLVVAVAEAYRTAAS